MSAMSVADLALLPAAALRLRFTAPPYYPETLAQMLDSKLVTDQPEIPVYSRNSAPAPSHDHDFRNPTRTLQARYLKQCRS